MLIQNSCEGVEKVANCFMGVDGGRTRKMVAILGRNILDVESLVDMYKLNLTQKKIQFFFL